MTGRSYLTYIWPAGGSNGVTELESGGNEDGCGDISSAAELCQFVEVLNVPCIDQDNDDILDVPWCMSWDNQEGNDCFGTDQALPNTKSKCNCDTAAVANFQICSPPDITASSVTTGQQCSGGERVNEFSVPNAQSNGWTCEYQVLDGDEVVQATLNTCNVAIDSGDVAAGDYTVKLIVTVPGALVGCDKAEVDLGSITVSDPFSVIFVNIPSNALDTCDNGFTATAVASGGSGSFSYSWTAPSAVTLTGATTDTVMGSYSVAGTYSVVATATDTATGCAASATLEVSAYDPISLSLTAASTETCGSGDLGDFQGFSVSVQGGTDDVSITTSNVAAGITFACTGSGPFMCTADFATSIDCFTGTAGVVVSDDNGICADASGSFTLTKATTFSALAN